MLMAADYDTHDCIKAFAMHPGNRELLALEYLLRRTALRLSWDIGVSAPRKSDVDTIVKLRLGIMHASAAIPPDDIKDMSEQERVALYVQLCKDVGIDLTPEDLLKSANESP